MTLRDLRVVDSHTEGNPTRVVVGGLPELPGATLREKRLWLEEHDDGLRGLLNFEPRGNPMMCSVLLLPPTAPEAHFAALIVEQDEYVPMCGHCVIGAATTVVAEGLVPRAPLTRVVFETLAGLVVCDVECDGDRTGPVRLDNVESFLLHRDAEVTVPGLGVVSVDVAFGGDFYAIVDADALGLRVHPDEEASLGAVARALTTAVGEQLDVRHPDQPTITRCYEALFTTANDAEGDYRHAVISPPGIFDRSPCGTGTSARLAALVARGELGVGDTRRFRGVLGTAFRATVLGAEERGGLLRVRPRVTGRAYLTAYSRIVLDPDDPFPHGYRVGVRAPKTTEVDR